MWTPLFLVFIGFTDNYRAITYASLTQNMKVDYNGFIFFFKRCFESNMIIIDHIFLAGSKTSAKLFMFRKSTGNPWISSIHGFLSSRSSTFLNALQTALLHLNPDPKAICHKRSPFLILPLASPYDSAYQTEALHVFPNLYKFILEASTSDALKPMFFFKLIQHRLCAYMGEDVLYCFLKIWCVGFHIRHVEISYQIVCHVSEFFR